MAGVKGRSGGRNAKTREELELAGTFDPSRHAGLENPLPAPGFPKPPRKLGKIAKKEWRRMVALLDETRTLSREIAGALYLYCQLFEDAEDIRTQRIERRNLIEKLETVISGRPEEGIAGLSGDALAEAIGNITKLALQDAKDATQLRQYALAMRTYLVEFGQTPAARSRVRLAPVKRRPTAKEHEPTPLEKLQEAQRGLRAV